jgi:thiol:disulfide interchange protein DsbC
MKKNIVLLVALLTLAAISPAGALDMDLGKALVIGAGPRKVIEFTDPDCPYCRKASRYFEGRSDVTRYIFFYPLPRHPRAKEKARYILSRPDRVTAYHDVMSGRLDSQEVFPATPQGIRLQEEHAEIARTMAVTSTPTFMINGRIIAGFEQGQIEAALGSR